MLGVSGINQNIPVAGLAWEGEIEDDSWLMFILLTPATDFGILKERAI